MLQHRNSDDQPVDFQVPNFETYPDLFKGENGFTKYTRSCPVVTRVLATFPYTEKLLPVDSCK